MTPNIKLNNEKSAKNEKKSKTNNIFHIVGNDIIGWGKNILKTLKYKPDVESVVQLHQNTSKDKQKDKSEYESNTINMVNKTTKYLNKGNFRFQIGKMQENDGTIYSEEMLRTCIEYMIKHTKEGEKSIIQIWSDVGSLLLQGDEDGVLPPHEQKERIKEFIRKNFGKKGECIEVIIGSKQGKNIEVFDALKSKEEGKRRFGIIPKDEPDIDKYLTTTKKEDLSPLPIIQYLAYHANKDEKLMELFYDTKPPKYKKYDKMIENYKPGSADADFYGIVEVGLRLTEILKGISIQGGVGRQRVYDKIISLILYGKDVIPINKECSYDLHFSNEILNKKPTNPKKSTDPKKQHRFITSEALYNLHKTINKSGLNTDFKQLYIELDRSGLDKIKEKKMEKKKIINNIKYGTLTSLILALGRGAYKAYTNEQKKVEQLNAEISKYEKEREIISRYPHNDSIRRHIQENPAYSLRELNHPSPDFTKNLEYKHEQEEILLAAYDLSRFNYTNNGGEYNEIIEEYKKITEGNYRTYGEHISAEDFMKNYIELLVKDYNIEYQEPYAHLKEYKQYIENTLEYGDKINLSKHKVEEVKIIDKKTKNVKNFAYYAKKSHQRYSLKFFKVHLDGEDKIVIFAAKETTPGHPETKFTLTNGLLCMQDLVDNYGI